MQPEEIKNLIETGLPHCTVMIDGDGSHFNAIVISPAFSGQNRIQKQQLVYATLKQQIADGTLHAISFKTYTPEEWDQHNNPYNQEH
jgi:acid stress-induced BolA-like protein IbaG/YrbA